jgi:hypothetical protein
MTPDQLVEVMRETGTALTAQPLPPFPAEADWLSTLPILDNDDAAEREWLRRIFSAVMLATSVEVCDALIRGERVPIERLDPEWVARFGLKVEA